MSKLQRIKSNLKSLALGGFAMATLSAALIAVPFSNAQASAKCGPRKAIIKVLESVYSEGRVAVGLSASSTQAYEIFVSDKGTWTLMMTTTAGATCIMAAGHNWEKVDESIKTGQES